MAEAAWGSTTAKATGGSSDPNVLTLKDANRIRLLEPGAVKWRQHYIESTKDADQGRSVVCPRGADGRDDKPCPLCMKPTNDEGKQRFPMSRRFATNVWDYESGSVKILIAGPQVFEEFDAAAAVGIDPMSGDYLIHKMGKGVNTSYKVVRGDAAALPVQITPDMLHDRGKYDTPTSAERIFELLEEMGWDYEALTVPSFTLAEAEAFVMPYTKKHKGETMEQIAASDIDFMLWLHGVKKESGDYGDPVFVAMQTILEARQLVPAIDEVPIAAPAPAAAPATTPPTGTAVQEAPPTAAAPTTVTLIGPDGTPGEFPIDAKDALLSAGYTEPLDEPTESGMKTLVGPDGSTVVVPQGAVEAMLAAGFTDPTAAPVAEAPAEVAFSIGDEDEVLFSLKALPAGAPPIPMAFKDAKRLFQQNNGDFGGENAEQLRTYVKADAADDKAVADHVQAAPDPEAPASADASLDPSLTEGPDDEGKFSHPALDKKYAAKGGVTQALNRLAKERGAATAPAASAPASAPAASSNGADPAENTKLEQAKNLLRASPIQSDFTKLLELFAEVSGGKRQITEFTDEDLDKLIQRLEADAAAAAIA